MQFNIAKLNAWIKDVVENKLNTVNDNSTTRRLHMLVLSNGVTKEYVLSELGVLLKDTNKIYNIAGINIYNSETDSLSSSRVEVHVSHEAEVKSSAVMEMIKAALHKFVTFTEDDKTDLAEIRKHIKYILSRHF